MFVPVPRNGSRLLRGLISFLSYHRRFQSLVIAFIHLIALVSHRPRENFCFGFVQNNLVKILDNALITRKVVGKMARTIGNCCGLKFALNIYVASLVQ